MLRAITPLLTLALLATVHAAHPNPSPRPDQTRPSPSPLNLPPKQLKRAIECRKELRQAERELRCALLRISLPRRIEEARKCRYNGLEADEYRRLRDLCLQREQAVQRVQEAERLCAEGVAVRRKGSGVEVTCANLEELERERDEAVAACEQIGWDVERGCEDLGELRWRLEAILGSGCGGSGVGEAEMEVERVRGKCERGVGGVKPVPSNPVRG